MNEVTTLPEKSITTGSKELPSLYQTYNCRHLRFLLDLFTALGITPNSYGNLTDNPRSASQTLRYYLQNDDMKISKAKAIVDKTGFKLDFHFDAGNHIHMIVQNPDYTLTLPEKLQLKLTNKENKYKNLGFLRDFMVQRNLSQRKLASIIEISPGAVETWFRMDDVYISYLYKIKEKMGTELHIDITEKEQ